MKEVKEGRIVRRMESMGKCTNASMDILNANKIHKIQVIEVTSNTEQ